MIDVRLADALDLMATIGDDQCPLIVTDPPYGIAFHSNRPSSNKHAPVARDWNFQIGPFWNEAARVVKPAGAVYVFTRWDVYPLWAQSIPPQLTLKNVIVWNKDNHSTGDLAGDFGNKYEMIMMLVKGRHLRRGHRWSNVWDFPRVPAKAAIHPTQKPAGLIGRIIESSTDKGDWVLDPFCGSGSTGEAAVACGRSALLGDVDPDMVDLARKRLGLEPLERQRRAPLISPTTCPVLRVVPPDPSLWGVHPEDLAGWKERQS